jgi:hypothetical protein
MDLGEVASATAVSVLTEEFAKAQAGAMLISLLPRLIQHANAAVHDCTLARSTAARRWPRRWCLRAALRPGHRLACGRLALLPGAQRRGQADHAGPHLGQRAAKDGLISASEIAESDSRHVLIRSLGPEMFVSPDTTALTLQPGDVLVLCTDGLHDEMSERRLPRSSRRRRSMDEIARELVARAVEIDGNDNTTAQVIRVRSVEQVGMYRGRPYRLPS